MKYTPGPWKTFGNYIIGYPESNIAIALVLENVGQPSKENAKLIAAAPDLLEALIIARENIDMTEDNVWKTIDDAIKKATV
jgi:hypothetical protein